MADDEEATGEDETSEVAEGRGEDSEERSGGEEEASSGEATSEQDADDGDQASSDSDGGGHDEGGGDESEDDEDSQGDGGDESEDDEDSGDDGDEETSDDEGDEDEDDDSGASDVSGEHGAPPAEGTGGGLKDNKEGEVGSRGQAKLGPDRGPLARVFALQWPEDYPIVQFPNAPLLIAIAAGGVRLRTKGASALVSETVGLGSFAFWAAEELIHGDNAVRRVFGGIGLGLTVARVAQVFASSDD